MYLKKEEILSAADIKYADVSVPEWGGTVRIKSLSGTERDQWELSMQALMEKRGAKDIRAKLAALTIVDENGKRIFSEGDVEKLGAKSASALDRVFDQARELSGLTAEAVEAAEGNSDAGQSGVSISD